MENIYLILYKNVNILINNNSGKWLAFNNKNNYYKEIKVYNNIDNKLLQEKYGKKFGKSLYIFCINKLINNKDISITNYKPNIFVIMVTTCCNLNCSYCYVNSTNKNTIKAKELEKIIKIISKYAYPNNVSIVFHGGEPLLAFSEIKKALNNLEYIKNVNYGMQTNGLLLKKDIIEELKKHNIATGVSVDGITKKNNLHRTKYCDLIDLTKKHDYKMNPLIVIHNENVNDLENIANYYITNGVNHISCNLLWSKNKNYCANNKDLFNNMCKLYDIMLNKNDFVEKNLKILASRVLYRNYSNSACNDSPCGAGKQIIAITPTGDIYHCAKTCNQTKKEAYMGNIYSNNLNNILKKKFKLNERNLNLIKTCNNCPYKKLCGGGGCPAMIFETTGSINGKSLYCNYYFLMITHIIECALIQSSQNMITNFKQH